MKLNPNDEPKPDRVTDVTGLFVGPSHVRVRARDADNEGIRHIRHSAIKE